MDIYRKGTKAYAEKLAKDYSNEDHNNFFHVIRNGSKYTVSKYYDENSIEVYKNGAIYLR